MPNPFANSLGGGSYNIFKVGSQGMTATLDIDGSTKRKTIRVCILPIIIQRTSRRDRLDSSRSRRCAKKLEFEHDW